MHRTTSMILLMLEQNGPTAEGFLAPISFYLQHQGYVLILSFMPFVQYHLIFFHLEIQGMKNNIHLEKEEALIFNGHR